MLGHANTDANDPRPTSIFTSNRDTLILPLVSSRTGGSRNDGAFGHWRVLRRRKLACLAFSGAAMFPYSSSAGPMGRNGGELRQPVMGMAKLLLSFVPRVSAAAKSRPMM